MFLPPQTIYFTQIYTRVLIPGKTNKKHWIWDMERNLFEFALFFPKYEISRYFFPHKMFYFIQCYLWEIYSIINPTFIFYWKCFLWDFFPIKMLFHSVSVKHFFLDLFSFFPYLFIFFLFKIWHIKISPENSFYRNSFHGWKLHLFFRQENVFFCFFLPFSFTLSLTH